MTAAHLAELAVHGVVATADANRLGLGKHELGQELRAGRLLRLIRGWYAVWPPERPCPPWEGPTPWERRENRHRLLIAALLRSFEGRVVASHQSALLLHDAALYGLDLETAHVSRIVDDHSRHRRSAVIHPQVWRPPVQARAGLWTVAPAIAVVQAGLVPQFQGRPNPTGSLVAADALLRAGAITHADLEEAVDGFLGHPGIAPVREMLRHATPLHESAGETRLASALRILGYDVETQVQPCPDGRSRVDFRLRGERVIVEFDGIEKYGGMGEAATPDAVRRTFRQEKSREDELRLAGYAFVRVQWAELDLLGVIRQRVERARAIARTMAPARLSRG